MRTYYGRHKNIYILLTMFTWGEMWCMNHDALGVITTGHDICLDLHKKTQSISKNTTATDFALRSGRLRQVRRAD